MMVEPRSVINWICLSVFPEDIGSVREPTL